MTTMTRRTLLAAIGAGAAGLLTGCGGFALQTGRVDRPADELVLMLWAGPEEEAGFRALADGFARETGVTVTLQIVPFSQALTAVDTGLLTGSPPDLFRVTYNDVGLYRDQRVLATLPDEDAQSLAGAVGEQFWTAVTDQEGAFGVPHHTDTTMVLLNTEAMPEQVLADLPESPEDAWTWEQFLAVAKEARDRLQGDRYAAAVNWQQAGAYRWLNWVDQSGGRLLTDDLTDAVGDPQALTPALQVTQELFREQLVPRSSMPKSSQYTDQLFTAETIAMAFVGNFSLPAMQTSFEWRATYLPQQRRGSADLGGNALVAVDGPRQQAATAFLTYCMGTEQQAAFCAATGVLPTRTDIDTAELDTPVDSEVLAQYTRQAQLIQPDLVEQVTIPQFNAVNNTLLNQLELAFLDVSGSEPDRAQSLRDAVSGEVTR